MSTSRKRRRGAARNAAGLLLALAASSTAFAQSAPTPLPPPALPQLEPAVETVVAPEAPASLELEARFLEREAWLEVTPLGDERPPLLRWLEPRGGDAEPATVDVSGLAPALAMVCRGGAGWAVACEALYLGSGATPLELVEGLAVEGRYLLEDLPIEGARVSVVPAGLAAARPFTLPLDRGGAGLEREVVSGEDGGFELPPLAAGDYFLEALLPSGRLHRSEVFSLPSPEAARSLAEIERDEIDRAEAEGSEAAAWDLGEIVVRDGLGVEVRVSEPGGGPISGARVGARQGRTPRELLTFQATAGDDGRATLAGFTLEMPATVRCEAVGYRPLTRVFTQVPALVECELDPLAAVVGQVIGPGGEVPPEARVSLRRLEGERLEAGEPTAAAELDAEGAFTLGGLDAGRFELHLAAPGYGSETRSLELESGERLDLGLVFLGAGREVEGRVIDAETGEPIAGVFLVATVPEGAGLAESDADGTFRLTVNAARPLVLETFSEDHVSAEVSFSPERLASGEPLEVELERGGWLRVVIGDPESGAACQGCRVVVHPEGETLVTDADGEAISLPLEAGFHRVERPRLEHLGSAVVERPSAEVVSVRIRPGRLTTVRFGSRRDEVTVRLDPPAGPEAMLEARGGGRSERQLADVEGGFVFGKRAAERLALYLLTFDERSGAEAEVRIGELPPGPVPEQVTIRRPDTLVHGRLTAGGEPLVRGRVRLLGLADSQVYATVRTGDDGRFRIEGAPPGGYNLTVGQRSIKFLSVPTFDDLDLGSFELIPGSF